MKNFIKIIFILTTFLVASCSTATKAQNNPPTFNPLYNFGSSDLGQVQSMLNEIKSNTQRTADANEVLNAYLSGYLDKQKIILKSNYDSTAQVYYFNIGTFDSLVEFTQFRDYPYILLRAFPNNQEFTPISDEEDILLRFYDDTGEFINSFLISLQYISLMSDNPSVTQYQRDLILPYYPENIYTGLFLVVENFNISSYPTDQYLEITFSKTPFY